MRCPCKGHGILFVTHPSEAQHKRWLVIWNSQPLSVTGNQACTSVDISTTKDEKLVLLSPTCKWFDRSSPWQHFCSFCYKINGQSGCHHAPSNSLSVLVNLRLCGIFSSIRMSSSTLRRTNLELTWVNPISEYSQECKSGYMYKQSSDRAKTTNICWLWWCSLFMKDIKNQDGHLAS